MDGDLQNDPADIPMLLDKLSEGYDAVFGLRANRQDQFVMRKLPSFFGNWLIRMVTGVHISNTQLSQALAETATYCWGKRRWPPRCMSWSGCAATPAGKCSRRRNRKAWVRTSTMRRPRR